MMAKKQMLGVMACPECGFPDAEIKPQKNGLLYRYCPDCNAQYFPRTVEASDRLAARMTPVSITRTDTQAGEAGMPAGGPEVAPAPVPEPEPEKKPASRARFNLGAL